MTKQEEIDKLRNGFTFDAKQKRRSFDNEIDLAIKCLARGGVLLHATDTVWGLATVFDNKKGIDKIYSIKQREKNKPLLLIFKDSNQLEEYFSNIPTKAMSLVDFYLKPITIIYHHPNESLAHLTAKNGSIAARIVKDKMTLALLEKIGKPLVSSSANISTNPTPIKITDINSEVIDQVDYFLSLENPEMTKKASQLVNVTHENELEVIRK